MCIRQVSGFSFRTKMWTDIKNYLFHFPLNFLFFIGKVQGLIVFAYETFPVITFKESPFLCTYSIVYTVFIVISLKFFVIKMMLWLQYFLLYSKAVLIFVFVTESMITAYRLITVYLMRIYYREKFRNILSEAVQIHQSLKEFMNGSFTFDKSFYRCYLSKVVGISVQFAVIIFLITLSKRLTMDIFYGDIITFVIVVYMHFTAIIISSIFHAGMMFVLLFYQNLNQKAMQIFNSINVVQDSHLKVKIKHQLYRRLTDEIDQITHIYKRISTFSKRFNKLFSPQLLLTILNAFYVILVQVEYLIVCK